MPHSSDTPAQPVYLFVVTHTTRYLDIVLAGLARQTRRPDHIVISCDTDDPAIGQVIQAWAPDVGAPIAWVRRAHHGIARCSQVRNNAVRFLINELGADCGRVIQIDGDILCPDDFVQRHAQLGGDRALVYPYRINVSEADSKALDARLILAGETRFKPTSADLALLAARDRRYRRQLWMRRLGLGPLHKPKLLGCNWSAPLQAWIELNGFDEHFQGWGYLDDEFARRAARAGWPCIPACRAIPCFHLYHATRQPDGPMSANPNHRRFADPALPNFAAQGLSTEISQHPVRSTRYGERTAAAAESHSQAG
jgi:hypothetical protein